VHRAVKISKINNNKMTIYRVL